MDEDDIARIYDDFDDYDDTAPMPVFRKKTLQERRAFMREESEIVTKHILEHATGELKL